MPHDQMDKMSEITELLAQCAKEEPGSHHMLASAVEHELRKMASNVLQSEPADVLWHTTALVQETWLRLRDRSGAMLYQNRAHFFCSAATAMRRIMVENARKRISAKRRGQRIEVDVNLLPSRIPDETAIAVHELLHELAKECPLTVQILEQLYFAGYSKQETAENLGISEYELNKKWNFSRAWVRRNLTKFDALAENI